MILFVYPFILTDYYDGSDEYDSNINCQNTCFQNGNNNMTRTFSSEVIARDKEDKVTLEELVERLKELKIIFFLEVILCVLVLYFPRRRIILKKRVTLSELSLLNDCLSSPR
ncbi:hypothetical protein GIB67_011916 [Kingdonia uniflora]|uniref:Uncharacterized protein n=1 Tax=Kingdonia uniflora TaxID=39325 RepID=A0A7J7LZS4_9MAGN|nr:hypothetical protein GIB67_011916 [Kingdonia uniflora]